MANSYNSETTKPIYRGIQIVWYILGFLEILLAFRFILKLLAANPAAGFTNFIYNLSEPFVAPFFTVFNITRIEGSVFEWTTLLAMLIYLLIAWGITRLLSMSKTVSTSEAAAELERKHKS